MMQHILSSREFSLIQKYVEDESGILLGDEKAYFIESRLYSLLESESLPGFEALYYKILEGKNKLLSERMISALTTNETFWFRDKSMWYVLEDILLPVYIKELRDGIRSKVRIWSAACSSGQEPYSVAMCIDHYLKQRNITDVRLEQFEILASDLSEEMLGIARQGRYDGLSMERGMTMTFRDQYFKQNGRHWDITDRMKAVVRFEKLNLKKLGFRSNLYDVILCKYVMIYFSDLLKKVLL